MARKVSTKEANATNDGFSGFPPEALTFLTDLAAHNDREWFEANRDRYELYVKSPMLSLISALSFTFQTHDIALTGDTKRSMFRIHRDVRFSKNKSPYKTNASCVFSRDGGKQGTGIFYLQIGGAEDPFMALGFYGPEPDDLAALRQAIALHPKNWLTTLACLKRGSLTLSRENSLSRIPKGFEQHAGSNIEADLKLKSLVVRQNIKRGHIHTPTLIDDALAFASAGMPLLQFGRNAIDIGRESRT